MKSYILKSMKKDDAALALRRLAAARELRTIDDAIIERIIVERPDMAEFVEGIKMAATPNAMMTAEKQLADNFLATMTRLLPEQMAVLIAASFPESDPTQTITPRRKVPQNAS